jgi:hypothetical protein
MCLILFCSDLSEDRGRDEEETRSSAASESDEEPFMRPVDHVGHLSLSLSDAPGTTC